MCKSGEGCNVVVSTSTPIPEGVGNFSSFVGGDISGSYAVFRAFGVNQEGIYTFIDNSLRLVANRETLIPGSSVKFGGFSDSSPVNSGKYVAFYQNGSLYTDLGDQLRKVIGVWDALDSKTIRQVNSDIDMDGDSFVFHVYFEDNSDAIYLAKSVPPPAVIVVSPISYDFGAIKWGQKTTAIFTITNTGATMVTVSRIALTNPPGGGFSLTDNLMLPRTLNANQSIEVGLAFTPTVIQSYTGSLEINSNAADNSSIVIPLSGKGVLADTTAEQVAAAVNYITDSISTGELIGVGNGASADNKVNAAINMIKSAGKLLEAGNTADGCQQLADIYKKVDGVSPPPDFFSGWGVSGLASAIRGLSEYYGCK